MAEFLIYRGTHWMTKLTPKNVSTMNWPDKHKYDRRMLVGDIHSVYEDGAFKEQPSPNCKFYMLKVPGLKYNRKYQRELQRNKLPEEIAEEVDRKVLRVKAIYAAKLKPFNEIHCRADLAERFVSEPFVVCKRRFAINISQLPAVAQETFSNNKIAEITKDEFLVALIEKTK